MTKEKKWHLLLAAGIGAFVFILVDMRFSSDASDIYAIKEAITVFLGLQAPNVLPFLITCILIIGVAVGCCFVYEPDTKIKAFTLGASIIALGLTLLPYTPPDPLKSQPNSVRINISIETDDDREIKKAVVRIRSADTYMTVGQSTYSSNKFSFYLDEGSYVLEIASQGYQIYKRTLEVIEEQREISLLVTLKRTLMPLFLQKAL